VGPVPVSQYGFVTEEQPTYLITGGTGFLGRHILQALSRISPRSRVVMLVRDSESAARPVWDVADDVEVLQGSLLRSEDWKDDPRLAGLSGIFHLAAEVKHSRSGTDDMIRTNVEGTASMVRLAAGKKSRLVFASTSGTVACSPHPFGVAPEEDAPYCTEVVGTWPYYASKVRAEKEARAQASALGAELVIFRPPVLLGPGDHRFRSTAHLLRLLRGKLTFILDGEIHFADVRDAADAMVRAMVHPQPKPIYHLPGHVLRLDPFFRMAAREAGIEPTWRILPTRLLGYLARVNQFTGLKLHTIPDPVVVEMASHHWDFQSRHAEADLGYCTRAPEETLRDTVRWIRQNHPGLGASPGSSVAAEIPAQPPQSLD
jgi:dihydroflavonol-4-reductase